MLDLGGIGSEFAQDLPVLGEHQKTAGVGLQVGAGGQAQEVALERTFAEAVFFAQGLGADRCHGRFRIHARRDVEQDGHRLRRSGLGFWIKFDFLVLDLELRLVDDFTVHGDPAALDEQLSLPTGTADEFDDCLLYTSDAADE